jgi:hypothetical protein
MCKISSNFKLCTCSIPLSELKQKGNYWILYKAQSRQSIETIIIGEPIVPYGTEHNETFLTQEAILDCLNSGNAFDVPLEHHSGARLLVSIAMSFSSGKKGRHSFTFEFNDNEWLDIDVHDEELLSAQLPELYGEVRN